MAVSKARKSEQLAALEVLIKDAKSVGFTMNNKLTVLDVSTMKRELRTAGATFIVAKKTLMRIAFKNVYNVDLDLDTLPGQVAIVVAKGDDAIAPLGIVNKYAKEWRKEEKITFVGGYMDGRLMGAEETRKLSSLPSREVLLAKLLGSMMSPLSGLARFLDGAKKELEAKSLTKVGDLTVTAAPKAEAPAPAAEAPASAPEAPAAEEAPKAE